MFVETTILGAMLLSSFGIGTQGATLRSGTVAPAFTLKNPEGKAASLSSLIKGKKATIVNFWFYG